MNSSPTVKVAALLAFSSKPGKANTTSVFSLELTGTILKMSLLHCKVSKAGLRKSGYILTRKY